MKVYVLIMSLWRGTPISKCEVYKSKEEALKKMRNLIEIDKEQKWVVEMEKEDECYLIKWNEGDNHYKIQECLTN